jgi:hypothetical protein
LAFLNVGDIFFDANGDEYEVTESDPKKDTFIKAKGLNGKPFQVYSYFEVEKVIGEF